MILITIVWYKDIYVHIQSRATKTKLTPFAREESELSDFWYIKVTKDQEYEAKIHICIAKSTIIKLQDIWQAIEFPIAMYLCAS